MLKGITKSRQYSIQGYQIAIKALILGACLVSTVSAQDTTTVYKVVNPDGSVTFSDQPAENAERLDVPPVSTVPAYKPSVGSTTQTPKSKKAIAPYSKLEITAPGNETAFYSGNGEVNVSTILTPALRPGHQYQFSLDGRLIATQESGSIVLSTVDRGTHTISVNVVDRNLKPLISQASTFTIHRPKVSRPSINP